MLDIIVYIYLVVFFFLKIINYLLFYSYCIFLNIIDSCTLLTYLFGFLVDAFFNTLNIPLYTFQNFIYKIIFFNYNFSSKIIYDINYFIGYITFITQVLFIVIITIWTRAAGPRFRLDQLLSLTWKDLFIYLSLFLIFILILVVIV